VLTLPDFKDRLGDLVSGLQGSLWGSDTYNIGLDASLDEQYQQSLESALDDSEATEPPASCNKYNENALV